MLDVACGSGRHTRWFESRGCRVIGIDRDVIALEPLRSIADIRVADLEGGPWPLPGARFDAVVCTNYLWRPLLPTLVDSVAEGGVLIYETFAVGNETVGRPSNPNFLLRSGELLTAARTLHVIAYEDGFGTGPERFVQRIVALRKGPSERPAARRMLAAG